jgi:hypothetical protein
MRSASLESALETMRLQYQYKRLVLLGKARLPPDVARGLVGPDCAYHLYARATAGRAQAARSRRRR